MAPMLAQQSGYQASACIGGLPSGEYGYEVATSRG
jgi:hypothetical protein